MGVFLYFQEVEQTAAATTANIRKKQHSYLCSTYVTNDQNN